MKHFYGKIPAGASFDRQRVRQHILYFCFFAIIDFKGNSLFRDYWFAGIPVGS